MARRWLRSSAPLLFLLLLLPAAQAFKPDFSFYPSGAQSCLNAAASKSKCSGGTSSELNTCLCQNHGDFVTNSAACIGKNDKGDVSTVYSTMANACGTSNTPLSVSQSQFLAAAAGDLTTSSTHSATHTATKSTSATHTHKSTSSSKPTNTGSSDSSHSGGLSSGAVIGIGVGAGIGGAALVAGVALYIFRRRRRGGEESHPMLPHDSVYGPTTFPPSEPSPGMTSSHDSAQYDRETKPAWQAGDAGRNVSPAFSFAPTSQGQQRTSVNSWGSQPQGYSPPQGYGPAPGQQPPTQQMQHPRDQQQDQFAPYMVPYSTQVPSAGVPSIQLPPQVAPGVPPVFEMEASGAAGGGTPEIMELSGSPARDYSYRQGSPPTR